MWERERAWALAVAGRALVPRRRQCCMYACYHEHVYATRGPVEGPVAVESTIGRCGVVLASAAIASLRRV